MNITRNVTVENTLFLLIMCLAMILVYCSIPQKHPFIVEGVVATIIQESNATTIIFEDGREIVLRAKNPITSYYHDQYYVFYVSGGGFIERVEKVGP